MTPHRARQPSSPPASSTPWLILSYNTPQQVRFARCVTTWSWQSLSLDAWTQKATPAVTLFDLSSLHLAFLHRWSINRPRPLMPQLSVVYGLVCGGGCITTTLNTDLNSTGDCGSTVSTRVVIEQLQSGFQWLFFIFINKVTNSTFPYPYRNMLQEFEPWQKDSQSTGSRNTNFKAEDKIK